MKITAKIKRINYELKLVNKLKEFSVKTLDINAIPASCIIKDGDFSFGISKWVSPKRTRSYPYARVYNTLKSSFRITVIPIIKDEGIRGDRDFIQWDTVSLMSLLNVYVIFAYYNDAEKNPNKENKITNQKLDNDLVIRKIQDIKQHHSSALHWNLDEVNYTFPELIKKVKYTYQRLNKETGVQFHAERGIDRFASYFINGVNEFMKTSRVKAQEAQNRENNTIQPKESLATQTKAVITISNYLGGMYYFTTDEIKIEEDNVYLIEGKHTRTELLPSLGDIKDGLLKMFLYTNLEEVFIDEKEYNPFPVIRLTSSQVDGKITSENDDKTITKFLDINRFSKKQKETVGYVFQEARENDFLVIIENAE